MKRGEQAGVTQGRWKGGLVEIICWRLEEGGWSGSGDSPSGERASRDCMRSNYVGVKLVGTARWQRGGGLVGMGAVVCSGTWQRKGSDRWVDVDGVRRLHVSR